MATKKQTTKAVTAPRRTAAAPQQSSTAVALSAADADELMQQDAGRGYEEAGRDAFQMPFLRILQDLSPQVKKLKSEYIAGAKPGQILHTVTKDLFDEVQVIPCHYSQTFIEWVPRGKKGAEGGAGFVAAHPAGTPLAAQIVRDEQNRPLLPNGNQLSDTRQHYVLLVRADGSCEQALIAMSSSQIKASKNWMTRSRAPLLRSDGTIRVAQPPLWARVYTLRAVEVSNDKGSWWGWEVADSIDNLVIDHIKLARAFHAQLVSGAGPRVNYGDLADDAEGRTLDGSAADTPGDLDNEIDA